MTHFFRRTFAVGLLVACLFAGSVLPSVSAAPTFDSGSTGADGAFAPTANVILQVPDSGVFNFTTVNIPNGVTVTFTRNANNTPVTILASGNVTIAGGINIVGGAGSNVVNGTNNNIGTFRSTGGAGGPGGFDGGGGGGYVAPFTGVAGDGPGGGGGGLGTLDLTIEGGGAGGGFSSAGANANNIVNGISYSGGVKGGVMYGSSVLLPLVGGSGGGGGGATSQYSGGSGGGGGGAILIACSGTTSLSGQVSANGGDGGYGYNGGGGGSGGAIRVIATTLAGLATVDVRGGSGGVRSSYYYGGGGAPGYIRFEAYNFNNFNPLVVGGQGVATTAGPGSVTQSNPPQLHIVSVAGINAPASPRGSLAALPDIIVQNTVQNPVIVALTANNVPVGTIVNVSLTPQTGTYTTVQSTALAGTAASSTATASVSLPDGKCLIYASATIDLTGVSSPKRQTMNGEPVDKILVAAVYGGPSEVTYVLHSGRKIVIASALSSTKPGRN